MKRPFLSFAYSVSVAAVLTGLVCAAQLEGLNFKQNVDNIQVTLDMDKSQPYQIQGATDDDYQIVLPRASVPEQFQATGFPDTRDEQTGVNAHVEQTPDGLTIHLQNEKSTLLPYEVKMRTPAERQAETVQATSAVLETPQTEIQQSLSDLNQAIGQETPSSVASQPNQSSALRVTNTPAKFVATRTAETPNNNSNSSPELLMFAQPTIEKAATPTGLDKIIAATPKAKVIQRKVTPKAPKTQITRVVQAAKRIPIESRPIVQSTVQPAKRIELKPKADPIIIASNPIITTPKKAINTQATPKPIRQAPKLILSQESDPQSDRLTQSAVLPTLQTQVAKPVQQKTVEKPRLILPKATPARKDLTQFFTASVWRWIWVSSALVGILIFAASLIALLLRQRATKNSAYIEQGFLQAQPTETAEELEEQSLASPSVPKTLAETVERDSLERKIVSEPIQTVSSRAPSRQSSIDESLNVLFHPAKSFADAVGSSITPKPSPYVTSAIKSHDQFKPITGGPKLRRRPEIPTPEASEAKGNFQDILQKAAV